MVLNLAYPENSEIEFKISKFPDGQQTIDITSNAFFISLGEIITIKSRLNNFKDLELILCANQALKNLGANRIQLYVPYFLGSRSDRKFQEGGINYLKQVICPIINTQNFYNVTVVDPHSDVLEACLNNYKKENNFRLVKFALEKIDNKNNAQDRIVLVSPDAGAYKKIFDVAKHYRISKIITATKVRDMKTGNILHTEIPVLDQHNDLTYVIIDDICDGGRTFIELAKVIKEGRPTAKIYLVVTHGIFSASFYELSKHIDGIFSTNSVNDIDVESHSDHTVSNGYLKQLNIF
jgi:ribose-phosphate pyrophosphokinase